jgi:hypothetical protein
MDETHGSRITTLSTKVKVPVRIDTQREIGVSSRLAVIIGSVK